MAALGLGARDIRAATDRSRTTRGLVRQLMRADSPLARAVWADMTVTGSRDSLVSAFSTARRAITWARRWSVQCEVSHRQAARADIAHAHGFAAWDGLHGELHASPVWPWVSRAAEEAALAKAVKQELFHPGAQGNERFSR